MMAAWHNKAPSPGKLIPAGRLLPPRAAGEPAPAGPLLGDAGTAAAAAAAAEASQAAAEMAADYSPEEEEFHDAREHLEGSQHTQQAQRGAAAAAAAAAGAGAGAALPPGALHLRTQPDEVQWTNLHELEPAESLPETQVGARCAAAAPCSPSTHAGRGIPQRSVPQGR